MYKRQILKGEDLTLLLILNSFGALIWAVSSLFRAICFWCSTSFWLILKSTTKVVHFVWYYFLFLIFVQNSILLVGDTFREFGWNESLDKRKKRWGRIETTSLPQGIDASNRETIHPQIFSIILEGVQSTVCQTFFCQIIRLVDKELVFALLMIIYYFVSRLSPLPGAIISQADEWGKVLGLFTLRRRKKLLQTIYRLTFTHSIRLATFAADIRR